MTLAGVILAGGESRRMGRDKAAIVFEGQTLLERQIDILKRAGASPVFVSRRSVASECEGFSSPEKIVADFPGAHGPIAGVLAGLAVCEASHLGVLAVDMPRMTPEFFQDLFSRCEIGVGAVGVVARGFEPLAAIYPKDAFSELRLHALEGAGDFQSWLARTQRMRDVALPKAAERLLENWNTEGDARVF